MAGVRPFSSLKAKATQNEGELGSIAVTEHIKEMYPEGNYLTHPHLFHLGTNLIKECAKRLKVKHHKKKLNRRKKSHIMTQREIYTQKTSLLPPVSTSSMKALKTIRHKNKIIKHQNQQNVTVKPSKAVKAVKHHRARSNDATSTKYSQNRYELGGFLILFCIGTAL